MKTLQFTVIGLPAPQGSKRHVGNGVMIESSKSVKPWRATVAATAVNVGASPVNGPVAVNLIFFMPRPKSHFRTGRNAELLRDAAPDVPITTPDIDKLSRAVLDALTGVAYRDDSQVVELRAFKNYTTDTPCAVITIKDLENP